MALLPRIIASSFSVILESAKRKILLLYAPHKPKEEDKEVTRLEVTVKDKDGNTFSISKDDPRYLSGELVPYNTGRKIVVNPERSQKGKMFARNKDGKLLKVDKNDPRLKTGELVSNWKGMVTTRDKDGNIYRVSKDDPRYLSGELKHINNGRVIAYNKNNEKIYQNL